MNWLPIIQTNAICSTLGFSHPLCVRLLPLSLAPGFSRVLDVGGRGKPFQRFFSSGAGVKPLKRLGVCDAIFTWLKPGANEMPKLARLNPSTWR